MRMHGVVASVCIVGTTAAASGQYLEFRDGALGGVMLEAIAESSPDDGKEIVIADNWDQTHGDEGSHDLDVDVADDSAPNPPENPEPAACYPDCDGNGRLDIFDMLCFLNLHAAKDPYADCDTDLDWTIFDFLCFVNEYNAGC